MRLENNIGREISYFNVMRLVYMQGNSLDDGHGMLKSFIIGRPTCWHLAPLLNDEQLFGHPSIIMAGVINS